MNIAVKAPSPGSAQIGDLYVDLQSRTLWLGVDAAVDPTTFVLISDIVGLQADIDLKLDDAPSDNKIYARKNAGWIEAVPYVHTHTASQITDFSAAVTSVVASIPGFNWVKGMIMQWSGSLAEIGVGSLAGWSLCDGSNGTPDLREKFILGAGSRAVGAVNAAASFDTTAGGGHAHTVDGTAISIAQLPAHTHGGVTGGRNAGHTHGFSATTGTDSPDHSHGPSTLLNANAGGTPVGGLAAGSGVLYRASDGASARHAHSVSGTTGGESADHAHAIPSQGGGLTHTHTMSASGGAHVHTITNQQLRETLPFFALAFIMKL